jgi:GNAT superfamily N-acetyltransferase
MEIQIEELAINADQGQELYNFLVENFYPEVSLTGEKELPLDIKGLSDEINHHLFKGKIFVAKHDDEIVGSIGVCSDKLFWTSEMVMTDCFFFVKKEYRGGLIATELLREAEEFADQQQIPMMIQIGNANSGERAHAFFKKHGYNFIGGCYIKGSFNDGISKIEN